MGCEEKGVVFRMFGWVQRVDASHIDAPYAFINCVHTHDMDAPTHDPSA